MLLRKCKTGRSKAKFGTLKFYYFYRDSYAFITFRYKCDTLAAIEHGNEGQVQPQYVLCFGGRRQFCQVEYTDLGAFYIYLEWFDCNWFTTAVAKVVCNYFHVTASAYQLTYVFMRYVLFVDEECEIDKGANDNDDLDFDTLLKQAMRR